MLTTKYQTLKEAEENLSNHYKWLTTTLNSSKIDPYLQVVLKVNQDTLDRLKKQDKIIIVQPSKYKTKMYQVWVDNKYKRKK
jgi:hypothetical protein